MSCSGIRLCHGGKESLFQFATWLAVLGCFLSYPVHGTPAQEKAPGVVTVEGKTETVRPAREEQEEAPLPPSSGFQAGARTVIDVKKYRGTQKTVADALREVPGVTVVQSGDPLSPTKVSIRGSRPDQVLIVVDGLPINPITDSPGQGRSEGRQGVDLASLDMDQVASIEIIRGAASSIYGPNAAAGVILIRTLTGMRESVVLARTLGPGGFRKSQAQWVKPLGRNTLTLLLTHRKTDGEFLFFDPLLASGSVTTSGESEQCAPPVGGGFRLRKCNKKEVGNFSVKFKRGKNQTWKLAWERQLREGLGAVSNPRPFGREDRRRYTLGFSDTWPVRDDNKVGLALNLLRLQGDLSDNAASGSMENHLTDLRSSGDLWYEHWMGPSQLRGGTAFKHQKLENLNLAASGRSEFEVTRDLTSLYGLWKEHLERGILEASLRLDHFSDLPFQSTYRLAMSRYLAPHFGLKASNATGYRPPTLYELFFPGTSEQSSANPDLLPEESQSLDGGFFVEVKKKFYFEALYFRQDLRNDIVAVGGQPSDSLFQLRNISRTRSTGLEMTLHYRAGRLNLNLGLTRTKALIRANEDGRYVGNLVPGIPATKWSAAVTWRKRLWHAHLSFRFTDRRFIDTANSRFLNSYRLLDAGIGFPIGLGLEGALEGKNLTNETYAELENFPPLGRTLFFTLRWRFERGRKLKPPDAAKKSSP